MRIQRNFSSLSFKLSNSFDGYEVSVAILGKMHLRFSRNLALQMLGKTQKMLYFYNFSNIGQPSVSILLNFLFF